MAELLVLLAVAALAAVAVAMPLLRGGSAQALPAGDDRDALELRHRVALDGLRDVEADHRAGSLDAAAYAAARAEAEAVAAQTLHDLDAASAPVAPVTDGSARRPLTIAGAALAGLLVVGFLAPAPIGLANRTVDPRRDRITDALVRFEANPRDAQAISDLADAYLAGDTLADLDRAQASLLLLINLQPANASAYARLATAQLRSGSLDGATATLDRMAAVAADSPDLPFLRGLVAREQGDEAEAREQFERFLEVAPDDARAPMIQALLEDQPGG